MSGGLTHIVQGTLCLQYVETPALRVPISLSPFSSGLVGNCSLLIENQNHDDNENEHDDEDKNDKKILECKIFRLFQLNSESHHLRDDQP